MRHRGARQVPDAGDHLVDVLQLRVHRATRVPSDRQSPLGGVDDPMLMEVSTGRGTASLMRITPCGGRTARRGVVRCAVVAPSPWSGMRCRRRLHLQVSFHRRQLALDNPFVLLHVFQERIHLVVRHDDKCRCQEWRCPWSRPQYLPPACRIARRPDSQTDQQLRGVAPPLVDVRAGVAALEPTDGHRVRRRAGQGRDLGIGGIDVDVIAASAADGELPLRPPNPG